MTDDTWLYGLDPMTTESPVMSLSIDDSVVWERTDVEKKERRGWVGPASARGEDENLVLAHGARCLVKVVLMGLCVCVALSEVEPRKEQPTCERAGLIISLSHATHCVGIRPAERAEVGRLAPLPAPLARQDDCRGDFVRSTVLAANYTPPAERARHTPNWIVTEPWLGELPPRPSASLSRCHSSLPGVCESVPVVRRIRSLTCLNCDIVRCTAGGMLGFFGFSRNGGASCRSPDGARVLDRVTRSN